MPDTPVTRVEIDNIVKSRYVQAELQRISAAHGAEHHCGDRNCEACWAKSLTAAAPVVGERPNA